MTLLIERLRVAGFSFVALARAAGGRRRTARLAPDRRAARRLRYARRRRGGFGAAEDLKTLRLFRATAKAAGGVLDLVMPMRKTATARRCSARIRWWA